MFDLNLPFEYEVIGAVLTKSGEKYVTIHHCENEITPYVSYAVNGTSCFSGDYQKTRKSALYSMMERAGYKMRV